MKQRSLTAAGIVALLILVLFSRVLTNYIFDIFILGMAVIGIFEMSKILTKSNNYNNKYLALIYPFLAYCLLMVTVSSFLTWYVIVLLQVTLIVVMMACQIIYGIIAKKSSKLEISARRLNLSVANYSIYKSVHTMFVYLYPTMMLFFFILINNLSIFEKYVGVSIAKLQLISTFLIILTFLIPAITDTFAYIFGSLIKGKKLCPKISPKKTISGAVSGLVFGTLSAILLFLIFNAMSDYSVAFEFVGFKVWHFAVLGCISSIMGQVGDIFESYLKRKANVKDSGTFLPGHGGILDRVDSHMFVAPIIFLFFIIIVL